MELKEKIKTLIKASIFFVDFPYNEEDFTPYEQDEYNVYCVNSKTLEDKTIPRKELTYLDCDCNSFIQKNKGIVIRKDALLLESLYLLREKTEKEVKEGKTNEEDLYEIDNLIEKFGTL